MKVAAYARYSSENQREESIEAQLTAIEEFCKKEGHIIVATYIDRALSATSDDRPEFLKMISDAKKKKFEAIIVHKLDRFARNRTDSAIYKNELKKAGVKLISVTERLDDSPESVILESVLEGMAEYYSRNLAREVMKGLMENAKEAKHCGGKPPLGYDVDKVTKKYVINEEEAKIVRKIFDMYLAGIGYKEIIDELNALGYKTKRGGKFTKNSLHDLIRNPIYAGYYVYGRIQRGKHFRKEERPFIILEDAVPAIISKEEYERVKQKMEKNRRNSGSYSAKQTYIFSGLLECSKCGDSLIGHCSRGYKYYICGRKNRSNDCDGISISENSLLELVYKYIADTLFTDENIEKYAQKLYDMINEKYNEVIKVKKELEDKIKKIEEEEDRIVDAILAGIPPLKIKERAIELDNQKKQLQQRLEDLERKEAFTNINKYDIMAFLAKKRDNFLSNEDKKIVVNEYVEKIKVYDDKLEISFKLPIVDPTTGKFTSWLVTLKRNMTRVCINSIEGAV